MDITLGHLYTPKLPTDHFQLHTHHSYEIYYMIDGIGHFYVEGNWYEIVPGTLLILRPGEMHRAVIRPNTPYERMFVHFSEEVVRSLDPELRLLASYNDRPAGTLNQYNRGNCDIAFIEICLQKIDRMVDSNYDDSLALRVSLYSILREIAGAFARQKKNPVPNLSDNSRIDQIIHYINLNLNKKLSTPILCDLFYISASHLNREFKKATGLSVSRYIRTKRLLMANGLIRLGQSVTDAAFAAGFSDYSAFYRAYCDKFNVSPQKTAHETREQKRHP